MKIVTALIALTFTTTSWGFDHNVVKGQWAAYQDKFYYFLNINDDYSGTFVRSLGHEPIVFNFKPDDVIKRDGYIEIKLHENQKAVLSAWKLKSGPGRLTGQVFMYKETGELFNMLHFPLQLLEANHAFLSYEEIKQLSATYR